MYRRSEFLTRGGVIFAVSCLFITLPILGCGLGQDSVPKLPDGSGKDVVCTVEPFANYVFHLMAVANIGYDSPYAPKYAHTIIPEDLAALRENRNLLRWGDGDMGHLTLLFVFVPVYLNLETKEDLKTYFSLVEEGSRTQDSGPWFEAYGDRLENLKEWLAPPGFFSAPFEPYQELPEPIRKLADIYIRNYGPYLENVWPIEKRRVEASAEALNEKLKRKDLIGIWERLTGLAFKFPRYEIILVSAAENGPSANSVGYERNVFWAGPDPEYMEKFISHEVGTHILFDLFRGFMEEGRDFGTLYRAYESLAMHYNTMIYPEKTYAWNYGEEFFLDIYARRHKDDPDLPARELLKAGLEATLKE
jgi:hypothetical protein